MIEIGGGITIGGGVTIGDVPVFITYNYFITQDGNNLVTQTDDPLVEEY
jgi:hypothetical protein